MKYFNTIRLVLVGVLFILGTMMAQANDKVYELKKKAIYYEIKAQLIAEQITLEEAQRLWQIKIKHLKKEEAK